MINSPGTWEKGRERGTETNHEVVIVQVGKTGSGNGGTFGRYSGDSGGGEVVIPGSGAGKETPRGGMGWGAEGLQASESRKVEVICRIVSP